MNKIVFFTIAIFSFSCAFAQAQPKKVVADKIVGKVGDRIILSSDIFNAIEDAKRQGAQLPANPECILMEGELVKKALVIQAEKDSLPISDDEIDAMLDNKIRYFIGQYGSREALEQIAGKTIYQLKEDLKVNFKEQKMAEQMRQKIVDGIKITPNEVSAYWDKIPKDSLAYYESELEVGQIVLYPKANRDLEAYTAKQLNDVKKLLESGKRTFAQMAKQYSQDPGSKDNSGQYNINRNEKQWDPTFLNTAFKLKEGQISNVVKSKFGLHIIQLVSRSGDDAVVRHILMIPEITGDELSIAQKKLDSIRTELVAGRMSFGTAVSVFSDEEDSKFTGGMKTGRDGSTLINIDQLDKDAIPLLKDLKAGQYSQTQIYTSEREKKGVRLLYLRNRTQPHRENLKDDYNRVAARALEEKKTNALEKWFADHIKNYYIFLDQQYTGCKQLGSWNKQAMAAAVK